MENLSIATVAALAKYEFEGTLEPDFHDPLGQLGAVKAGDAVTGDFTIDNHIPNAIAGQPCSIPCESCGLYPKAIIDFNLQVGKFAFHLSDLASVDTREVALLNKLIPSGADRFFTILDEKAGSIPRQPGVAQFIYMNCIDPSAKTLTSAELVDFEPSRFTNPPGNGVLSYEDNSNKSNPFKFKVSVIKIVRI